MRRRMVDASGTSPTARSPSYLSRAAASIRSHQRMPFNAKLRAILPAWSIDFFRADLSHVHAGDGLERWTQDPEAFVRAAAAAANVNVTFTEDSANMALGNVANQLFTGQGAGGANIKTWPDALWWAAATASTVGYGDRFPVTAAGRMAALVLMISGIALLGVITASLATVFVSHSRAEKREEEIEAGDGHELRQILDRLTAIESSLAALQRDGADGGVPLADVDARRGSSG